MDSVFLDLRKQFHQRICETILGTRPNSNVLSVADGSQKTSVDLARRMAEKLPFPPCTNPRLGQTAGELFTQYTMEFLEAAFQRLHHLRPGAWIYQVVPQRTTLALASYDQYGHLSQLKRVLDSNPELAATLGGDYFITPDVVIARLPIDDSEINANEPLIHPHEKIAQFTPLRSANYSSTSPRPILHASISCKWTMRSDRAQNARTEALNLIRNRKGNTPHIAFVTFEPLPSRIASIAMGTGDIDCTYHGALHELMEAVAESGNQDQAEILDTLVRGRRLRDISDLPFDLAV